MSTLLAAAAGRAWGEEFTFGHPGLLHSATDLARMKGAVAAKEEPVYSGYRIFARHAASQLTYKMQGPLAAVGRNGGAEHSAAYDNDATAAYHLALLWTITGEKAYAERSKEIVNAWSRTLEKIDGRDAVLMAGLGPFKMVNAAEILRYSNCGWTEAEAKQAEKCFREAVYPVVKDFALFANGNWDTAAMKTVMAIGIFCNDREIFENGMRYYVSGAGNGCLTHYIINEAGQCQESGRDAGHWQLGIGHLADCCEMAWNQGLDLYGFADNRLLKGFEYAAAYNLGGEVAFEPMIDRTGKYPWAKIAPRGPLKPIYEQVYGHYVMRMGMDSPPLERAVKTVRPEGAAAPIGDHPGFGTLLFARGKGAEVRQTVAAPAAVIAKGMPTGVELRWIGSVGASGYTMKRGAKSGGPYATVARDVKNTTYVDKSVDAGKPYYYVVSARGPAGESLDSYETEIAAGLPGAWKSQDIGDMEVKGWTQFDGRTFTVDGAGRDMGGVADECQFAIVPMRGDGEIVARFVPQMSGMRSKFGVMMRESVAGNAAQVALLIGPAGRDAESPGYSAVLVQRAAAGGGAGVVAQQRIGGPQVVEGRFMEPYWVRLVRAGKRIAAFVSGDGKEWTRVNEVDAALNEELLVGLAACSGIIQSVGGKELALDTVIRMDHVAITK
ncbi:MAG TPA: alginate lyase family protein [Phycisphaerae bacterium]|nr:alginate lyase family protein [Phycisphaerae bacterium]